MSDAPRRPYQGGLFSPPIFNCTNDPYEGHKRPRPRTTSGSVETQGHFRVSKEWQSKFIRAFEGEGYRTMSKIQSEERLKGKAKFLNPSGFRFSSPSKKNSCPGAFDATFRKKPIPYVPPVIERRVRREKIEPTIQPQIVTQPMKKPSGSAAVTPNAMFSPFVYESSPYDAAHEAEKKRMEEIRARDGDRPPFKVAASVQVTPLPPSPIVARLHSPRASGHQADGFSKSPSRDLISDSSLVDERTRSSSFKAKESSSGAPENHKYSPDKPFKPPHILRSGAAYATFSPFPPHVDDPFDDRKVRMAVNSDRLLPMQIQTERLPSLLATRRAWTPTSPAKEMFTKSIDAITLNLSP